MKIRAAVLETMSVPRPYVDLRPLVVSELELEAPGPGELLVKIHAAGLCHSDLSVIDGNGHARSPSLSVTKHRALSKRWVRT